MSNVISSEMLQVMKPEANTANRIKVSGNSILFNFDAEQAMFERVEGDLVLTFEDGSSVTLEDFFVADSSDALPVMSFTSGEAVSGADFLASLDIDVMPAAGPQASVSSSGGGDFGYDPGSMIDGLGRLGGLDVEFSNSSYVTEDLGTSGASGLVAGIDDGLGGIADGSGEGGGSGLVYSARAVLYMHEYTNGDASAAGNAVTLPFVFKNAQGQTSTLDPSQIGSVSINGDETFSGSGTFGVNIGLPNGWQSDWINLHFDPATGRLVITMTPEGLEAMGELASGEDLLDYISVSVTDEFGNNYTYNVQIVASPDENYDSHERDQQDDHGRLEHGEYHSGKGNGSEAYTIRGSQFDDEINIDQTLSGATIYASQTGGQNTGADDYNTINLTQGMTATAGRDNLVDSTDGVITVNSGNGENAVYANGGTNTIQGGKGDVNIHAQSSGNARGVLAQNNGENIIEGGDILATANGADSVGVFAQGGTNTVTSSGSVTVEAKADANWATAVSASHGSNTISADGKMTFRAEGTDGANATGIASIGNSTNTITSKNGDIEIGAKASGNDAWAMGIQAAGQDSANIITAENGNIDVTADGKGGVFSQGVRSEGYSSNGQNVLTASGNVNISAINASENNTGISAHGNGALGGEVNNVINAGHDINVLAQGQKDAPADTAIGVWAGHDGGRNELNAGRDIKIEAYNAETVYGVYADRTLDGNTIKAENNITIKAENGTAATGIFSTDAENGNIITAGGTVSITATGGDGNLAVQKAEDKATYGVRAKDSVNGNTITAGESIDVTANGSGDFVYGVAAQRSTGGNSLTAESGDISIDVTAANGYGRGLSAVDSHGDAQTYGNTLLANDGSVNITVESAKNAHGIEAENSSHGNFVYAKDNITVNATADASHSAAAMYATGSTDGNVLEAGGDIELHAKAGYSSSALDSVGSNRGNTVTAGGSVTMTASGMNQGNDLVTGIFAGNGSAGDEYGNKVVSQNGDISVTLRDVGNQGVGVWAHSANNILDAQKGSITVDVESAKTATGLNAGSGNNDLNAGQDIIIGASAGATAQGINTSGGTNTLTAAGDIQVTVDGRKAEGVKAAAGNNTLIADGSVGVDASSDGDDALAVFASGGSNSIRAGKDITLVAEAQNGYAYGIHTYASGSNTLDAGNDITVDVTASHNSGSVSAYGIYGANTNLNAGGNVEINAHASGVTSSSAYGSVLTTNSSIAAEKSVTMDATANSTSGNASAYGISTNDTVTITAGQNIDLKATATADNATSYARGMAVNTGVAELSADRNVTLAAQATGDGGINDAYGVVNYGVADINAGGSVNISATATGDDGRNYARGLDSFRSASSLDDETKGTTTISAENINITATATGDNSMNEAFGVRTSSGSNTLNADSVNITATATGDGSTNTAYGMAAEASGASGGKNTINASNVEITADAGETGTAYGLHAGYFDSTNTIRGIENQGVSVTITAKAGAFGQAMAMYAEMGTNQILGTSSKDHGTSDNITINGDMVARNGHNIIRTGSGDDTVRINGDISGKTTIDLGDGDNWLFLNGSISGNVSVTSGDGYDTIVLNAASYADFMALYGSFLTALLNGEHSIDAIATQGMDPGDMDQLAAWLADKGFDGEFGSYNEETGSVDPYAPDVADMAPASATVDTDDFGPDSDFDSLASIVNDPDADSGIVFESIAPMQGVLETPDILADVNSDIDLVSTVANATNSGSDAPHVDSMLSDYFAGDAPQAEQPTDASKDASQDAQPQIEHADVQAPIQEIVEVTQQTSTADDDAIAVQQAILNTTH